jgi:hypothetical protein
MKHVGPGVVHALQKVPGFKMSAEKFGMVIKLRILSSDHSTEDPAQVNAHLSRPSVTRI